MRIALFTVLATSVLAAVVLVGFGDVARAGDARASIDSSEPAVVEASQALHRLQAAQVAATRTRQARTRQAQTQQAQTQQQAPQAASVTGVATASGARIPAEVEVDWPLLGLVGGLGAGGVLLLLGVRRQPL